MNDASATPAQVNRPRDLVELLTVRQYLAPHQPVRDVLRLASAQLACPAPAVDQVSKWLHLDLHQPIGRLRRSELIQLANAFSRFSTTAAPLQAAQG
jgi:hypothetical protein